MIDYILKVLSAYLKKRKRKNQLNELYLRGSWETEVMKQVASSSIKKKLMCMKVTTKCQITHLYIIRNHLKIMVAKETVVAN